MLRAMRKLSLCRMGQQHHESPRYQEGETDRGWGHTAGTQSITGGRREGESHLSLAF